MIESIAFIVLTVVLYLSWRKLLLPLYEGPYSYGLQNYGMQLDPYVVAKNFFIGIDTIFIPWNRAVYQILSYRPPFIAVLLSVLASASVWIISFALMMSTSAQQQNRMQELRSKRWLRPLAIGIISVVSLVLALTLSASTPVESINGIRSRINFAALFSMALVLPSCLALLVEWPNRKIVMLLAFSVVFASIFLHSLVLLNDPRFGALLNGKSSGFVPSAISWSSGIAFALTFSGYMIASLRRFKAAPTKNQPAVGLRRSNTRRFVIIGFITFIVFTGSLFQASVAHEWSTAWKQYKTILRQLESLAPGLEDQTFVFIVGSSGDKTFRNVRWRVVSGPELSVHMLMLYNNWSILGYISDKGAYPDLQFYSDGFEVAQEKWFAAGAKGPAITTATAPIKRISYDRVLLLEAVDGGVRLLRGMEVRTVAGERLILANNPSRILPKADAGKTPWHDLVK
jgi:hypothetical protein